VDPLTGEVPEGIEAQTHQTLVNIKAIVEAAGSSMSRVLKTTVFLTNIADAAAMNAVYAGYSCLAISAFVNSSWLLEIEAVAALETSP
jgi:enamine deaminase RidA (YjgF/YER057c/UK114 family)